MTTGEPSPIDPAPAPTSAAEPTKTALVPAGGDDEVFRLFAIEVLTCPRCQGPRRLLAAIFDPDAIGKVLQSLGLPAEPPVIAPPRPPPQARLPW